MRTLSYDELKAKEGFFLIAQEEALKSTCLERKCGAVLVNSEKIIGKGFNSPPGNIESQRRCNQDKTLINIKVTDKTCCIHAEQRALMDAFQRGENLKGSTMYFTSVNDKGERLLSGKPYCTLCSKIALEMGIEKWVLEQKEGGLEYSADEYNKISFNYVG